MIVLNNLRKAGIAPKKAGIVPVVITLGLALTANCQTYSLAYVSSGDLWVRSGSNASARRFTSSGAGKSPRFSADGSFIAFLDNGAVKVASVSTSAAATLPVPQGEGRFTWSPTGNTLAVWNQSGLYLFSQRDSWAGEQILKGDPPRSMVLDTVFNNDGQKLVIATRNKGSKNDPDVGTIVMIDLPQQPRTSTLLAESGNGFDLYGFSRDGSTIFFWKVPSFSSSSEADGLELYALSISQRTVRRLQGVRTLVHKDLLSLPPEGGSLLATLIATGLGRETWSERPIADINVSNGAIRIVSSSNMSALFPARSPSGDDIAYVQAPEGRGVLNRRKLWIARRYGGYKRQLTFDGKYRDERPMWLSNETILFCRIDASYRASLWTITKDGLDPTHVAGLSVLPDRGFGYYGYVDWGESFDVWVPYTLCTCRLH